MGLTWGPLSGIQGWGVVHTELGAGQGLGAAGWARVLGLPDGEGAVGFGGLKWEKTGSGDKR